jgi:hypothetical protein
MSKSAQWNEDIHSVPISSARQHLLSLISPYRTDSYRLRRSTGEKHQIIVDYTVNVSNECLFEIIVGNASILNSLGHGFLDHVRIIEIVALARLLELKCAADRQWSVQLLSRLVIRTLVIPTPMTNTRLPALLMMSSIRGSHCFLAIARAYLALFARLSRR